MDNTQRSPNHLESASFWQGLMPERHVFNTPFDNSLRHLVPQLHENGIMPL